MRNHGVPKGSVCPTEGEASRAKDDLEEEIAQFDAEIGKKVMINEDSTFLGTVDNLKVPPEGFWLRRHKDRVTGEIPNALLSRVLSCQFHAFWRKLEK